MVAAGQACGCFDRLDVFGQSSDCRTVRDDGYQIVEAVVSRHARPISSLTELRKLDVRLICVAHTPERASRANIER
jgi:hypothetical protein